MKKLTNEYEQERQFKYIPVILPELKKFAKGKHKTLLEAVEKAMEQLAKQ
jgi:mannose/fructose/N-acetylgalactosamine-specific phosphotransferase system component IID